MLWENGKWKLLQGREEVVAIGTIITIKILRKYLNYLFISSLYFFYFTTKLSIIYPFFLASEYAMNDLEMLHYLLGIVVRSRPGGLFLSHHKYAADFNARVGIISCKSTLTRSCWYFSKLSASDSPLLADPTLYRCLVGSL